MAGLHRCISADVLALFNLNWSHPTVPVFWRADDLDPRPDPSQVANYMRNSLLFGPEKMMAYGGGRGANLKSKFGQVEFLVFAARGLSEEDTLLDLLSDAVASLRSQRVVGSYGVGSDLSFIGDGSGFDVGPTEDGNWFVRGERITFEYRFTG